MSIRQFRPMTAATRFRSVSGFDEITRDTPEKSLLEPKTRTGGRNNLGHVTARYKGGAHKKMYRRIDFKRDKLGIPGRVTEIEYDPNRSARIALVVYADGEKRYILHPKGLAVGDSVVSGPGADIRIGNAVPLAEVPLGTAVHNVELKIGKGGQLSRTAGASAQVVAKEGDYVTLRLRSTEMRLVHGRCLATIGEVGNAEHELLSVGKAGKSRWLGRRPRVRGVAKNPVDRFANGSEFLTALRACGAAVSPALPGRRTAPRFRAAAAIVAGIGLLLVVLLVRGRPDREAAGAPQTAITSGGAHVLWVDDDPSNNAKQIEILEHRGVRVTTAVSTAEALERYDAAVHDVVVSDMGRPEGTNREYVPRAGLALLTQLRAREPGVAVILYTTARSAGVYGEEARTAGARGVVTETDSLVRMLTAWSPDDGATGAPGR